MSESEELPTPPKEEEAKIKCDKCGGDVFVMPLGMYNINICEDKKCGYKKRVEC